MSNRDFASKQLNMIHNRILKAACDAQRDASDIQLIGASKQQSPELISDFHHAGLSDLGENYLQEAITKQLKLHQIKINWHFIGKVQSNKCKTIAQHFDWVHSIERLKVARRLGQHRVEGNKPPINILIQLNVDQEKTKGGISISDAPALCDQLVELEGICLRGFMLIPAPINSQDDQRRPFAIARETLELCNQSSGLKLDSLSMGMSNDLEAAILEGATMIRVGTSLFGARAKQ